MYLEIRMRICLPEKPRAYAAQENEWLKSCGPICRAGSPSNQYQQSYLLEQHGPANPPAARLNRIVVEGNGSVPEAIYKADVPAK
jgi:hypothetical protein